MKRKNKDVVFGIIVIFLMCSILVLGYYINSLFTSKVINLQNKEISERDKVLLQFAKSICDNYDMTFLYVYTDGTLVCNSTKYTIYLFPDNNYKKYVTIENDYTYNSTMFIGEDGGNMVTDIYTPNNETLEIRIESKTPQMICFDYNADNEINCKEAGILNNTE